MTLDAPLVAATTLWRITGGSPSACTTQDAVYQLQLAHVLLDGGYDGVATLADALAAGDHGLGTVDRLDGELVIVDGEPWRVDAQGRATLMPADTRTPFAVVTTLESPRTARLRDLDRAGVIAAIEDLVDDRDAVVAVRLEGSFTSVLVRSVPAQEPPYRPYAEVCASDEVRWEHRPFFGTFVGFRFPDLDPAATIPGLHLHGLDRLKSTGGHNHDLQVRDAVLSVGISRDVVMHLPDRSMLDLLETPPNLRRVQRQILRGGSQTIEEIAAACGVAPTIIAGQLDWLADRGYVTPVQGSPTRWTTALRASARRGSDRLDDILRTLADPDDHSS